MIIEICKTIAINIFWVLAAFIEIIALLLVVLGLLSNIIDHLHNGDQE